STANGLLCFTRPKPAGRCTSTWDTRRSPRTRSTWTRRFSRITESFTVRFDAVLVALAVLAGSIAAISGFGIGSLLTPVLMVSMRPADAVAVLAIPHAVATSIRLLRLRSDVDVPTLKQFGVASAIGGLTGAMLQARLASPALTIVLAVLLVLSGSTELARRPVPLPQTPTWRLVGGL